MSEERSIPEGQGNSNKGNTFVYHSTEPPRIVTEAEAKALYKDGWRDTPAAFKDGKLVVPEVPEVPKAMGKKPGLK